MEENKEKKLQPIVWIDMEMTGLDPDSETVLEIATVLTDNELNLIAKGPELVIYHEEEAFDRMDDWNQKHHLNSGLWGKVRASSTTIKEAEKQTLEFLQEHLEAGKSPLAGNSVWQDRRFIAKYMPLVDKFLHYRIIDVSTVKELVKRWNIECPGLEKKNDHRAMGDILESIEELRVYKQHVFKTSGQTTEGSF